MVPAQAFVANHLKTYVDFPPRQRPGSFSLDQVLAKLNGKADGVSNDPADISRGERDENGQP